MENKSGGVWIDDILCGEKLSGTEKLWRDIYRIADEFYLLVKLSRYPLVANTPQYKITICKVKKQQWYILFEEKGMEMEPLLRKIKRLLNKYRDDHKEYIVQKSGGGEFI